MPVEVTPPNTVVVQQPVARTVTVVTRGPQGPVGPVSSVSGTAPIEVATGTTTPVVSIVPATTLVPGSMSAADKAKLDGVATGATANSSDAALRARSSHTGTQTASTISDFAATTLATVLAGLSLATGTAITAADTVLTALGKLQKQISDLVTTVSGKAASGAITGSGLTMATNKLLGRGTASTGAVEEITLGTGLSLTGTTLNAAGANNSVQDFRLTLTSGVPVTTADVATATTIYATPMTGKYIDLYDGTNWNRRASAEFSLALGTLTSALNYDVFCYDNAGVPTLEFTAWTSTSARATALAYQDGVLVKSGAATRRYLGSFYTISTTQTCDMDVHSGTTTGRYLSNYYHRVKRSMSRVEGTGTWAYASAAWRQANASTANQLNFLIGVSEDAVFASLSVSALSSSVNNGYSGIGLDSTTPTSLRAITGFGTTTATNSVSYEVLPAAGRHFLAWCEFGAGAGTLTWNGTSGEIRSGMYGSVMA